MAPIANQSKIFTEIVGLPILIFLILWAGIHALNARSTYGPKAPTMGIMIFSATVSLMWCIFS